MSEWIKRLIGKNTITCWYCKEKVDKTKAYSVELDTLDGKLKVQVCNPCGDDLNDVLREIEKVKDA